MRNKPDYYRFHDLRCYKLYEGSPANKPYKELSSAAKFVRRVAQISTKPVFLIFGVIEKALDASAARVAKEINGEIAPITHRVRDWAKRNFTL